VRFLKASSGFTPKCYRSAHQRKTTTITKFGLLLSWSPASTSTCNSASSSSVFLHLFWSFPIEAYSSVIVSLDALLLDKAWQRFSTPFKDTGFPFLSISVLPSVAFTLFILLLSNFPINMWGMSRDELSQNTIAYTLPYQQWLVSEPIGHKKQCVNKQKSPNSLGNLFQYPI